MQIERDRLLLTLSAAEREAGQARLELFRELRRPATDVRLTNSLEDTPIVAPVNTLTIVEDLPDVAAARNAVAAAEADVKLQHALAYPDPDIIAGYKRNSGDNTGYLALQIPRRFGTAIKAKSIELKPACVRRGPPRCCLKARCESESCRHNKTMKHS